MRDARLDLDEELTLAEAAERLELTPEHLGEILQLVPFGPLPVGPDGSHRIPGIALWRLLDSDKELQQLRIRRLIELTTRMRGPREPLPDSVKVDRDGPRSRRGRVSSGGLIRAEALAALLDWNFEQVSAAVRQGRLYSIEVEGAGYFPREFGEPRINRRELEVIFRTFGPKSPWAAYVFLTNRMIPLGDRTPMDALREGQFRDVFYLACNAIET